MRRKIKKGLGIIFVRSHLSKKKKNLIRGNHKNASLLPHNASQLVEGLGVGLGGGVESPSPHGYQRAIVDET